MTPELKFVSGLLALIFFLWYLASSDQPRRRRLVGTLLTLLMVAIALGSALPLDKKISLGLDLKGGTSFLLRLVKLEGETVDSSVRDQAVEVIRKRIDTFGVSEPVITPEGNDRILVQIPGMDPEKIEEGREQLRKVAKLDLRLVHKDSAALVPLIMKGERPLPLGWVLLPVKRENVEDGETGPLLLVKEKPDIEGSEVKRGVAFYGDRGWGVSLRLTSEGAEKFGKITKDNVGRQLAIVLDGVVQSAPVINDAIYTGEASITGRFSEKEALTLASVLENPLAVPVEIAQESSASATLGADAVRSGIYAGIGGLIAVVAFIVIFYRFAGIVAFISLMVNMILLIGGLAMFNFVLTLPGIAGIILTIGLAVDASVLIFERLREELAAGKPLTAALDGAYSKAFSVIFDANVTTLIMSGILFWYATGPVKGFAVTLTLGVMASVFTAMIVGRTCFGWATGAGLKKISMGHLVPPGININFLGRWKVWLGLALAFTLLCATVFTIRGEKNFGIDFRGGDLTVLQTKRGVSEQEVRDALKPLGFREEPIVQLLQEKDPSGQVREYVSIRSGVNTSNQILKQLNEALPDAGFAEQRKESIGELVGKELATSSAIALGLGLLGILLFVSIRFEFAFAVGAVVSLLNVVIVTLGMFSILGRELSLVMVGAVLAVAGYAINDTIVVFDRIRESLHSGRRGTAVELTNKAINETLSRTLLTAGTTLLAVLSLYIFGGPVLNDFALAIIIGVAYGTIASIFVASPIAIWIGTRGGRNFADMVVKQESSGPAEA